jgi:hypothetical protein
VEAQPVAVACVREAVRRAGGTSCVLLAAAACAIPRACVRSAQVGGVRQTTDNEAT